MGMFGSSRRAASVDNLPLTADGKLTLRDKALAAAAALSGDLGTAMQIRQAPLLMAQRKQITDQLTGMDDPGVGVRQILQVPELSPNGSIGPLDGDVVLPGMKPTPSRGPDWAAEPKQASPMSLDDPRLPAIALQAKQAGVDIGDYLKILEMRQPNVQYDRGFGYNAKTGQAVGGYHADLDKGQVPLYDADGRFAGVRNADGAVQSAADMAGAVEAAKARATAPYQFQTVTGPDGRPRVISNATAAALGGNGGIIAAGQSPAQTEADKATAMAGANANIALPQTVADAQQAVQLIQTLKANPALNDRTGWKSLLPALPGTPGAAFDAADDQLRGKLFMQAYGGLKGGGQITEVEGKKATQAIARLSRSQSPQDYVKALDDLQSVIETGMQRATQQPGRLQPRGNGGRAPVGNFPAAPAAPQRQAGAVYNTPRGPMKWTGTGWLPN